jgi:hypothetical protein
MCISTSLPSHPAQVGTEKLREWFSSDVLKPLQAAMASAHRDVIDAAAAVGVPGMTLSPLDQGACSLITMRRVANCFSPLVPRPAGAVNTANMADDNVNVAQFRARIEDSLRNPMYASSPQLKAAMQAIVKYQKLVELLRGDYPSGFMTQPPEGYIACRVQDLASEHAIVEACFFHLSHRSHAHTSFAVAGGTCMIEFSWNAGGRWNGKAWSSDMPTDSTLLLYLFAAYLAAPHWVFTVVRRACPGHHRLDVLIA